MSLSSLNSMEQSVFELESGNENVDGQTDVGHINLIGGLVTCNPPKNDPDQNSMRDAATPQPGNSIGGQR